MNLLLFEEPFATRRLEGRDPRAAHLREVLRVREGAEVHIGFVNGPRAIAVVRSVAGEGAVDLEVREEAPPPPQLPLTLLVGLPRPHTAKRVLFDAASAGVARLVFFESGRGEASYARSRLWEGDGWRRRLLLGAEQGFTTRLPEVARPGGLEAALAYAGEGSAKAALDNYEAAGALPEALAGTAGEVALAVGSERGWTAEERRLLRARGWPLAHLGPHVLRTEAACLAAVAATAAVCGFWRSGTAGDQPSMRSSR